MRIAASQYRHVGEREDIEGEPPNRSGGGGTLIDDGEESPGSCLPAKLVVKPYTTFPR